MRWNTRDIPNKEKIQAQQELKILEEDVITARNFIRKNRGSHFHRSNKIPIYLIFGPARFGKTTLLSRAGLDLIGSNKQQLHHVTPTKYCSFWFAKNVIYIDTAGAYTKPDITKPRHDLIWQGFIKLLQKYFGKNSIAGALIILDLPAIAQNKELLNKSLFCLRERIYDITNLIKTLPLHIIFTKCDQILGFTEFFSLSGTEERAQPFGIAFAGEKHVDLIGDFEIKFNQLLERLNNRVMENLQKSIHPRERPLLKTFPSQIDHLRPTFIEVINKIPHSSQILFSGIYFTSSLQDGAPINPIKATLLHILKLQAKPAYAKEARDNRSYFIEELFKKRINSSKKRSLTLARHQQLLAPTINHLWALLVVIFIVGISSIIGYQSYRKNILAMDQITLALEAPSTNNSPNNLIEIITQLEKYSTSWWLRLGINKTKALQQLLTETHQNLLTNYLTSELEKYLNTAINNQDLSGRLRLYRGLKIYLMLGRKERLNLAEVKNWFNDYWIESHPNKDQEQKQELLQQLFTILLLPNKINLNQQIISLARENLNHASPAQLAYLLLENTYADQTLNVDASRSISKMYTKEKFHEIYNHSLANTLANLQKYDWVIGDLSPKIRDGINGNTINDLKDLYIEQYVAAWESLIQPTTNVEFKSLTEIAKHLKSISAPGSSLFTRLKQIKYHTDINDPPPKLSAELNTKLPDLSTINLEELKNNLGTLARDITLIADNSDPNQAAFIALVNYLRNNPHDNPITALKDLANRESIGLRNYLLSLTNNIWQVLFEAAYNHINYEWNHLIMPKYQANLEHKYPLFKESKEDVRLEDFNNFFGPHGVVDGFFSRYIEPLVNADKTNWTWKSIDDQKINFSSTFLEVFLRAALIQKMFYPSKISNLKLEFTLTPTITTHNIMNFILHIDGQKVFFTDEDKKTQALVWPGPQPGSVTISFINAQGKYFTLSELGTWAWFRMLDRAHIISNSNTRNFDLTFDLDGNIAKYTLSTIEPVNPFIPEIISNFRCREQ